MKLENGKVYKVNHTRKGNFDLYVESQVELQDETWITGIIVEGKAQAMLKDNEKFVGDEITVRKSLLSSASLVPLHYKN